VGTLTDEAFYGAVVYLLPGEASFLFSASHFPARADLYHKISRKTFIVQLERRRGLAGLSTEVPA